MNWSILFAVLSFVESSNNPNAIGDNGAAVGRYQIHKIFVDEVNRILDLKGVERRYTYEDRKESAKCQEMIYIYVRHWCAKRQQPLTYENACRLFNSGPDWLWETELTDKYWAKCLEEIEKMEGNKK